MARVYRYEKVLRFYRLPRRGWRATTLSDKNAKGISTHSLTKRLTRSESGCNWFNGISTHSLTKRLTTWCNRRWPDRQYFNSQPHEEADNPEVACIWNNDVFQLTASRRGWLLWPTELSFLSSISTHRLTKRMTWTIFQAMRKIIFQLTASRRGWLIVLIMANDTTYFNSQPHEEADLCYYL